MNDVAAANKKYNECVDLLQDINMMICDVLEAEGDVDLTAMELIEQSFKALQHINNINPKVEDKACKEYTTNDSITIMDDKGNMKKELLQ